MTNNPTNPGLSEDLADLLGQALEEQQSRKELKASRERVRTAKPGTNLEEDLARIAKWEREHVWQDEANVAVYHRFACLCGHHQTVFEGVMLRQHLRRNPETVQLVAVDFQSIDQTLPKEIAMRKTTAAMCVRCSWAEGFEFHNVQHWEI